MHLSAERKCRHEYSIDCSDEGGELAHLSDKRKRNHENSANYDDDPPPLRSYYNVCVRNQTLHIGSPTAILSCVRTRKYSKKTT